MAKSGRLQANIGRCGAKIGRSWRDTDRNPTSVGRRRDMFGRWLAAPGQIWSKLGRSWSTSARLRSSLGGTQWSNLAEAGLNSACRSCNDAWHTRFRPHSTDVGPGPVPRAQRRVGDSDQFYPLVEVGSSSPELEPGLIDTWGRTQERNSMADVERDTCMEPPCGGSQRSEKRRAPVRDTPAPLPPPGADMQRPSSPAGSAANGAGGGRRLPAEPGAGAGDAAPAWARRPAPWSSPTPRYCGACGGRAAPRPSAKRRFAAPSAELRAAQTAGAARRRSRPPLRPAPAPAAYEAGAARGAAVLALPCALRLATRRRQARQHVRQRRHGEGVKTGEGQRVWKPPDPRAARAKPSEDDDARAAARRAARPTPRLQRSTPQPHGSQRMRLAASRWGRRFWQSAHGRGEVDFPPTRPR